MIGARGSWTFDNLLSPGPRLYLELKEVNMLLCQYDREDCWKRNLKMSFVKQKGAESVAQGIQLLDNSYQTLKTSLLDTITW